MYCKKCGKNIADDANFCPNCGTEFAREKKCNNCGRVCLPEENFCMKCGFKLNEAVSIEEDIFDTAPEYGDDFVVLEFEGEKFPNKIPEITRGAKAQKGDIFVADDYIYYLTYSYEQNADSELWRVSANDQSDNVCLINFDYLDMTLDGSEKFYVDGNIIFTAYSDDEEDYCDYFYRLSDKQIFKTTKKLQYWKLTEDRSNFYSTEVMESYEDKFICYLKIADIADAFTGNFNEYELELSDIVIDGELFTPIWDDFKIYNENCFLGIRGENGYCAIMFPIGDIAKYKVFPKGFRIVGYDMPECPVYFYKNYVVGKTYDSEDGDSFSIIDLNTMDKVYSIDANGYREVYQYLNFIYFEAVSKFPAEVLNLKTLKSYTLPRNHKILYGDNYFVRVTPKGVYEYEYDNIKDKNYYRTSIYFLPATELFSKYIPNEDENVDRCVPPFICNKRKMRKIEIKQRNPMEDEVVYSYENTQELHELTKEHKAGDTTLLDFFYSFLYIPLPDGTFIGFKHSHHGTIYEKMDTKDYYYNLYKVDGDGNALFLNAGSRGGVEQLYIYKNYIYWTDYFPMRCRIDGTEFINSRNEFISQEYEKVKVLAKKYKKL